MKMRSLAWVLVPPLIGVVIYTARSGDLRRWWAICTDSAPVLECPATVALGEREVGKVAVARFTVANRGGGELLIDQIRTNCACSGLEREQDGQFGRIDALRLGPNEQTEVAIRVLVQGPPGEAVRNRVDFRSNDATRPRAAVDVLVSKIQGGVTILPNSVGFGVLSVGSEGRQVLEVFDAAVEPRVIDRVVSSCPEQVAVRLLPVDGTSPQTKKAGEPGVLIGRVEVMTRARAPGSLDGHVAVHLAGEDHPPTKVRYGGRVAPPVEVVPSLLVLPRATEAGPVYSGQCLCRSTDDKPLTLTAESTPEGLSVHVEAVEGIPSQWIVRIEWDPAQDEDVNRQAPRKVRLRARVGNQDVPLEISVTCLREGSR